MSISQQVLGIAHIGIRVYELERARTFYELLGFNFVVGPIGPEPVAIMSHPSGIEINFILNAANDSAENVLMDIEAKHAGYTHIALTVQNVAEVQAELEKAGVIMSGGPITFSGGSVSIFVRDPDRNVIEFNQPA